MIVRTAMFSLQPRHRPLSILPSVMLPQGRGWVSQTINVLFVIVNIYDDSPSLPRELFTLSYTMFDHCLP